MYRVKSAVGKPNQNVDQSRSSSPRHERADALDVAGDKVPAQAIAHAQRRLEVHPAAGRRACPGSCGKRLGARLEAQAVRCRTSTTVRQQPLIAMLSPSCRLAADFRPRRITIRLPGDSCRDLRERWPVHCTSPVNMPRRASSKDRILRFAPLEQPLPQIPDRRREHEQRSQ